VLPATLMYILADHFSNSDPSFSLVSSKSIQL
jgi:hypothetical protein